MPRSIAFALVSLALVPAASLAGPVQSYTASASPSASEGLRSLRGFIPAADPRPGLLITPAPHPAARVDSPDREENGRVWAARSPVGNRSPLAELTRRTPGAAWYGAAPDSLDEVVWVQPTRVTTVIGISPWQRIDADTLRQVQRHEKSLGRTVDNPESAQLLADLREAQRQWLQEQGYILAVRTHVNPARATAGVEPATRPTSATPAPRGVIRVLPAPAEKVAAAE